MKGSRHAQILAIIDEQQVETQEMLTNILRKRGYSVTQATVSRDIRELKIRKVPTSDGKSVYYTLENETPPQVAKLADTFRMFAVTISLTGNLVVIKTVADASHLVEKTIIDLDLSGILGITVGCSTVAIITADAQSAKETYKYIEKMLK